jgi:DNA-binding NarL/FixJ family response regulator
MTEKALHILIADDHPIFRQGLRHVIENEHRINTVIEEASDGQSALEILETKNLDLAILDIEMPVKNGLDVVRALKPQGISCPIIFLTMYDDQELFDEAIELGVMGYVLKENAVHDILDAINAMLSGKPYISALMSSVLLKRNEQLKKLSRQLPSIKQLTSTERRILLQIANGKTSKRIAEEMHLSFKTINNHRNNIASKLNIHGTHNLLKFAVQHKSEL